MAQTLRTPRLDLVLVSETDVEAILAVHSDPETMAPVPWRLMTSRDQAEERLVYELAVEADTGLGMRLMYKNDDGALVGACGGQRFRAGVEIGWITLASFQGRGYATEAGAALALLAEESSWTVYATIRPGNAPSLRVADKLGFIVTGSITDEFGEMLVLERRETPRKL